MKMDIKRRSFLTLLAGTAAASAWPLAARAQQQAMPVIGYLSPRSPDTSASLVAAFRQGLATTGYAEGRNVIIDFKWANNQVDRLPALAAELVRRPVSVIAAFATVSAHTAKAATTTIPIVFGTGDDPIRAGIVTSFNRPTGNVTGITFASAMLGGKRLELLRVLAPKAEQIALFVDPKAPESVFLSEDVLEAARSRGWRIRSINTSTNSEIEEAFKILVNERIGAVLISGGPFLGSQIGLLVALAARHAIPVMYQTREFPLAGGLISYGARITDMYRDVGIYTGRILRGDKPTDLPVTQPTRYELVINLITARAQGIEIPPMLLALADEVVE
jgi:putative ABC transport system substrate-binding protein